VTEAARVGGGDVRRPSVAGRGGEGMPFAGGVDSLPLVTTEDVAVGVLGRWRWCLVGVDTVSQGGRKW